MGPEKSWRVCFMQEIRGGSYLRRTPQRSLNIALKGLFSGGDHVITTVLEHNSVLRPLYECRENGVELTILGCDGKGRVSYEEMEAAVQADTKAVVCTHASNLTGNMTDLERVGTMAKRHGLLFCRGRVPDRRSLAHRCGENADRCALFLPAIRACSVPRGQAGCMSGKACISVRCSQRGAGSILTMKSIPQRCPLRWRRGL